MLDVKVFNISEGTQSMSGRLVLTPLSRLSWFGFSENGQLSSYDSKVCMTYMYVNVLHGFSDINTKSILNEQLYFQGILRVFSNQFGGSWLPLFRYLIYST